MDERFHILPFSNVQTAFTTSHLKLSVLDNFKISFSFRQIKDKTRVELGIRKQKKYRFI
jgi:hypothetical protein